MSASTMTSDDEQTFGQVFEAAQVDDFIARYEQCPDSEACLQAMGLDQRAYLPYARHIVQKYRLALPSDADQVPDGGDELVIRRKLLERLTSLQRVKQTLQQHPVGTPSYLVNCEIIQSFEIVLPLLPVQVQHQVRALLGLREEIEQALFHQE